MNRPATVALVLAMSLAPHGMRAGPESLDALAARIDRTLLEQNEADIRAWLDARIADTGDFGVYPFNSGRQVQIQGDTATVDLNRGALADAAVRCGSLITQFVWDARLALGLIDAATAARGGGGWRTCISGPSGTSWATGPRAASSSRTG